MWVLFLLIQIRDWLGRVDVTLLFPVVLLVLNVAAAIVCFHAQDWRRGVYWLASAVCIAMVAFR
jgi:hypothetical protein